MMKTKSLYNLIITSLIIIAGASCNNDDAEGKQGIAVDSVTAVPCVDLTNRAGWLLRIGYGSPSYYKYTVHGKTISASPQNEPYRFEKSLKPGDEVPIASGAYIYFSSPQYLHPAKTDVSYNVPDISDQSTIEKLYNADLLYSVYTGKVSNHLTDVSLIHANAMLEFELLDIENETELRINSARLRILPYQDKINPFLYRAIVPGIDGEYNAGVMMQIDGETYNADLTEHTKTDTHYKFTVHFDKKQKKLLIENLQESKWSEEQ